MAASSPSRARTAWRRWPWLRPATARIRSARPSNCDVSRFPACIMATAVVPWTSDFRLDEALFRDEVRSLLRADYRNLYIFGTAAEGYAVDDPQFEQIARVFVDEMRAAHAEPMLGVINLAQATILRRVGWARDELGVRLFQISLPSWGALEEVEVRAFFD